MTIPSTAPNWQFGPDTPFDPDTHPALFRGVMSRRIFAYVLDWIVIALLIGLATIPAVILGILSFGLLSPLLFTGLSLIPLAYHTLCIGRSGATLGMRAFGLRVKIWNGGQPGYLQALLLTLCFYFSLALTSGLILLVPLFSRQRRCLHDLLLGTIVVRT